MPSTWDHQADKDLLLALIESGGLKSIVWPNISSRLSDKGYTFSKEACRQHFQKIRKEARNSNLPPGGTPMSSKRTASGSKGKAGNARDANSDDDEDEMPEDTPSKKRKRASTSVKREKVEAADDVQNAAIFKVENLEDAARAVSLENDDIYA